MKQNNNSTNLEDLNVYKNYVSLVYYSYMITRKFPKSERIGLESDIKRILNEGLDYLIVAQKAYSVNERIEYLNKLDCKLKALKLYVRVSKNFKYISGHNYGAWSRKITSVTNLLGGWIKSCRKQ